MAILADVQKDYRVDPRRIYLTGMSSGGDGVWALAAKHPDVWAALAPVCGNGDPNDAAKAMDKAHAPVLSGYGGYSSIATLPYDQRNGSFFFVQELTGVGAKKGAYEVLKKILKDAIDAGKLNLDPTKLPTLDVLAEGTIAHELAHQFSSNFGHYNDSDGDGLSDTESDFETIQYNYAQPGPGYLWQDYWMGIKYGHGYANKAFGAPADGKGFLRYTDLDSSSMLDDPNK